MDLLKNGYRRKEWIVVFFFGGGFFLDVVKFTAVYSEKSSSIFVIPILMFYSVVFNGSE